MDSVVTSLAEEGSIRDLSIPSASNDVLLEPIPVDSNDLNDSDLSLWSRFSFGSLMGGFKGSISLLHSGGSGGGNNNNNNSKNMSSRSSNVGMSGSGGVTTGGTNLLPRHHELASSARKSMAAEQWTLVDAMRRTVWEEEEEDEDDERDAIASASVPGRRRLPGVVDKLPPHEKDRAVHDVYGLAGPIPAEDPARLRGWKDEMDRLLRSAAKTGRHHALQEAIEKDPAYVRDCRVAFLRAADWMPDRAVGKMGAYFDLKRAHFGPDALCRDVTFADMAVDLEYWKNGFLQLLEERDRSGRPVVMIFGRLHNEKVPLETVVSVCVSLCVCVCVCVVCARVCVACSLGVLAVACFHPAVSYASCRRSGQPPSAFQNAPHSSLITHAPQIRVSFYLAQVLVKDETVQRAGIVVVVYGIEQRHMDSHRVRSLLRVWLCLPLRVVALHVCYDSMIVHTAVNIYASLMRPFHAMRFRAHYGTRTMCLYNLMTYGIPRQAIPVLDDEDGTIDVAFHSCFLDALVTLEHIEKERRLQQQQARQQPLPPPQDRALPAAPVGSQDDELQPYDAHLDRKSWDALMDSKGGMLLTPDMISSLASTSTREEPGTDTYNNGVAPQAEPSPNNGSRNTMDGNYGSDTKDSTVTGSTIRPLAASSHFVVLAPGPEDVIMGRGRHNKSKPGNRKLARMLEEYHERYEASDKFQKTVIAQDILTAMTESGSRFLIRESPSGGEGEGEGKKKYRKKDRIKGLWVQVTQERARDKIAHDFRNLRRTDASTSTALLHEEEGNLSQQSEAATASKNKRALSGTGGTTMGVDLPQRPTLQQQKPQKEQKRSIPTNPFAGLFFF